MNYRTKQICQSKKANFLRRDKMKTRLMNCFLVCCLISLQACKADQNVSSNSSERSIDRYGVDSVKYEKFDIGDTSFLKKCIVFWKQYTLVVYERQLNDSIPEQYSNMFNQLPILSGVLFYLNDSLIAKDAFSFKQVKATNFKGEKKIFLDNKISTMNIVVLNENPILEISSFGGCNSCNESVSYYSFSGDLLSFWYGNKDSVVAKYSIRPTINDEIRRSKHFMDFYF